MNSNLIVMLTMNDQTVENAIEIFNECKDLAIDYWGFKNVGISEQKMQALTQAIKGAKKQVVLEVVTYSKEACLNTALFASKNKIDYLIGTCFYERAWDFISKSSMYYFPFVGKVYDSPSVLAGNMEDIVSEARILSKKGVPGIDLLAYRYTDGNPVELAKKIKMQVGTKMIMAGSVNSFSRLKEVHDINPWAFTIGGALFRGDFVQGAGFRANLVKVLDLMNSLK